MNSSVLMVMTQMPPAFIGGAEKMAETFAREFQKRGMLYRVVTRGHHKAASKTVNGLRMDVLPFPNIRILGTLVYMFMLGAYLIRHRRHYDTLYLGLPKYNAIICAALAGVLKKALVIKFESPTWERQNDPTHRIRCFGLFVWALRHARAVVVLNEQMRQAVMGLGVVHDRVVVIPNAVDTCRFAPVPDKAARKHALGLAEDRIIVFLGRLIQAKGVHELLRAVASISSERPSLRLLFIGDGPERDALIQEAQDYGIADRVTIQGLDDPSRVLPCGDLFVLPSESEGVSCALLEGMASGLCAVATPVGGNCEVMTDNETGVFVPVGDADRLAAMLADLLDDDARRTRLAEAGRAHVRAHYSLEHLASRYEDLLGNASGLPQAKPRLRRVLQVITTSEFGGAQDVVLNICRALKDDYEPVVVTTPGGVLIDHVRASGIPVYTTRIERNNDPRVIWRLRRLLRDLQPDLVHAHDARAALIASLAARLAGSPPVIYHVHLFNRWRAGKGLMSLIDRISCRLCTRIVTCSDHLRGYLAEAQGICPDKLTAIPNCVDTEKFAPRQPRENSLRAKFPKDAFVLLYCARLTRNKGIIYLLNALALARPRVCLVLAGDGELRSELAAAARELGIADRVLFAGYLSDVRPALAQCDAYVQPSLVEGLPIAVLEAMSMGKPVLATAISGTPEIVRHEQTGLCVPPADATALHEAMTRFLEQPAEREAMASRGRELVRREYSLSSLRERLCTLYAEILEEDETA